MYICNDIIIVTNNVPVPTLLLPVMNVIKFTHVRITSLIIKHMVNIPQSTYYVCVEIVIVCVSINPMIVHSVFMTIGCCVVKT